MRPTPRAPRRTSARRLTSGVAVCTVVALTLGLAGCTGDGDDEQSSTPLPSGPAEDGADLPQPGPVQVRVKTVWGRWPDKGTKQSDQLAKRAGSAVTQWMDKAFVDLDYPTPAGSGDAEVGAAFATFTSGAADQARRQADLTTNIPAGRDLVDAVATRRVVRLIGYAPGGTAVGATAAVELVLVGATDDGKQTETAVTGDLYLTRAKAGWRVFGYDLERSTGAPGSYARAHRDDNHGKGHGRGDGKGDGKGDGNGHRHGKPEDKPGGTPRGGGEEGR